MRMMVIGASTNRDKYGNKAVRAYAAAGHTVLPVNPRAAEIEGLTCFPTVAGAPGPIDRAALYLPPPLALEAVGELGARGDVAEVFFNPGTESQEAMTLARSLGMESTFGCAIVDIGASPYAL
ncbi:MAG TPA: CoA-binding protein [Phycisphaerales bacterium]|nr:CoA-binding protein [Phycisphaerales bacterium]